MSTTVTENIDELFDLVRKSNGVISTHEPHHLVDKPEAVEEKYRRHARTHVSLGDTGDFENDILTKVTEKDSPTRGYLYGKYGYGKTSTSVSIWNTLSNNNIIAVPPFKLKSFTSIMRATHGWMQYELSNEAPDYKDDLEEIHETYLQKELQAVAKEGETEHDLDADRLAEFLQDANYNPTLNANTLIEFFKDCTDIALEAGFDGLVIIADELQIYFNSADNEKHAESRLRQLVGGLESGPKMRSEFGLFMSMPESTKSMLDSRAEDILNRLQMDNLVLNLQNIYGRQFPTELWDRFAEQFGFEAKKNDVITEHALIAFGEVCSRNDLSNGPRTVMDLFRIAITKCQNQGEAFTAFDLAEAFYHSEVRYTGSATKIETAIGDALAHAAVDTGDKEKFIKLCAVFPVEGIPEAVVEEYGLADARTALSKKLHGEVIKVVAEGYALTDVTKTENIDPIRELIRDFWRDYGVGHAAASEATDALANKLINGEFLEAQRGTLDGWTNGGNDLNSLDHTVFRDQFEGTYDTRFPKRKMSVAVSDANSKDQIIDEHGSLGEDFGDPDLALNFVLHWDQGGEDVPDQFIRAESDREYTFVLNGRQSFDTLPPGLDFLRDAMDPKAVTPFLMLALVNHLNNPTIDLDAQQQSNIESFKQSLLTQSLKALFDEELINNAPFDLRRTGKRSVVGVFTNAMESLHPDYSTVITSTQYRDLMEDYRDFLGSLETTSQRRGKNTVLEETPEGENSGEGKQQMARRFGLRGTSSFDNRLKTHYHDLVSIVDERADQYELCVKLHPFEQEILNRLEDGDDETLSMQQVERLAQEDGYRDEEVDVLVKILLKRGLVEKTDQGELILDETDVTIADVEEALETCRDYIDTISRLDEDRVPEGASDEVAALSGKLEQTNPEDGEKLEALKIEAESLIERLEDVGELLYDHYRSNCRELKRQAERARRSLIPNHLADEVTGGVQFVGGLNDARTNLMAEYQNLRGDLSSLIDNLERVQEEQDDATLESAVELHDQHESTRQRLDDIQSEAEDLEIYANELKRWRTFTNKVGNVKQDIKDYSRTFDETIEEDEEIDEIIGEIRERLADSPLEALTNREAFDQRVEHTKESYEQHRDRHRSLFNEKQDQLNNILDEATDGKATKLRVQFDVKAPSESKRRLVEDFRDAYRSQVLKQSEENLDSAITEVEYAQIVDVDAATDTDPGIVEEQIEQARSKLRDLHGQISRFEYADIGDGTDLATAGADLLSTAIELHDTARDFRAQSEPESEAVQDLLRRVENNRGAEFKELLMEYHENGEPIDVDELLDRMEQLFKLNQIDIRIKQRRGR
jgi:hypothetical protein